MSVYPAFQCLICHQVPQQPQWSLDRRVQKYRSELHQGQPRTVVQVLDAGDMFLYDSQACWQVHEPTVIAALKLKTSYPVDTWIGDTTIADAILDRVMHKHHRFNLTGETLRKSEVLSVQAA